VINASKINYSVLSGRNQWNHCGNLRYRQNLFENVGQGSAVVGYRSYGMLIGRVLRGALKLRYILLGGAVGGTVTMNKVKRDVIGENLEIQRIFFFSRNTRSGEMDCRTWAG
jgi:acyl CoA:acetate/3-ketoacid CoA transferase alpha subunit